MRIMISTTIVVLLAGCGSVPTTDSVDARAAAGPDARACPPGTAPIPGHDDACIERVERGTAEWDAAETTCLGIGRRLCTDDEWGAACAGAVGVDNMTNDEDGTDLEWEWIATESGGIAGRRGYATCDDESEDAIAQPVDYRCCADR